MRRMATVLVVLLGLLPLLAHPAHAGGPATPTFRPVTLTGSGGVQLTANVVAPRTPGPHPGIVFVNSWAVNDYQYIAQATLLAGRGYVVLSYAARGWWGSGGEIGMAGADDVADFSAVLDWMVGNTDVDPARIGAGGMSYGSGISLLAAAHDPRVRAVAALSTWADISGSFYSQRMPKPQAVKFLEAVGRLTGRPSAEMTRMFADYYAEREGDAIRAWADLRSPITYLKELNRNAPAVLLANSYSDSLFPPDPLADLFTRLTGPKRLEFAPGDHAVVEIAGLAALPNHVWTSVHRWFDHYLRGIDNGIDTEAPVVQRPRNAGTVETRETWAEVSSRRTRFTLGPQRWNLSGRLARSPQPDLSWTIRAGVDTTANGGVAFLSHSIEALTGVPPTVWLPSVNRAHAGVWVSEPLPRGAKVRGGSRLHLTVDPRSAGTAIAYLYDLDALGTGRLISHTPIGNLAGSGPRAVEVAFPATGYDVPAGHQFALVVDTEDPLYLYKNTRGTPLTFLSPSWLEVGLR